MFKRRVNGTIETPPVRRRELLSTMFLKRAQKLPPLGREPRTRSDYLPIFPIRRRRQEYYKRSPAYRGAKNWNSLPSYLQRITDKFKFKIEIKKFLGTNLKGKRKAILLGKIKLD